MPKKRKKVQKPAKRVVEFEGKVPRTLEGKPAYGTQEAAASKRVQKNNIF
jgi:hypothetical protein